MIIKNCPSYVSGSKGVRVMSDVILFLFLFAGFWCAIGFTVGYFVGKTNEVNNDNRD